MPIHIKASSEDIARNVITSGDPGRVDLLSTLLTDAKIVNTHRGLKTITGYYKNSRVTIATHGIGAPSAAIVFEELHQLGARRIIRLGTAGGIRRDTKIGDVVVATAAAYNLGGCSIGQYMPGICGATGADPKLTSRIMDFLEENNIPYKYGPVFSSDAFYAEDPSFAARMEHYGIVAVEMEAAVLFSLGWMRKFEAACVLVISDVLHGEEAFKKYLTTEELAELFIKIGKIILEVYNKYYKGE
ncbi:MAG: purine-nucleoside phosphorylase [Desulfurococcaceae archaeon]